MEFDKPLKMEITSLESGGYSPAINEHLITNDHQ